MKYNISYADVDMFISEIEDRASGEGEVLHTIDDVRRYIYDRLDATIVTVLAAGEMGGDEVMLTKQQLEEIAERADKATEGPWGIADISDGAWIVDEYGDIITGITERLPDATFIANSRRDIPDLLEHIADREAEIERLQKQVDELYSISLWTARRLSQSYKPMVYDWIDEVSGKENERL